MKTKEEYLNIIDNMIDKIPGDCLWCDEIWLSLKVSKIIDIVEYKGFKIYSHWLMPKEKIVITKAYYEDKIN